MKGQLGDLVRLRHILDAIQYINKFTQDIDKEKFISEPMIRFSVERQLEIIGEAANHLSQNTKQLNSEIDWRKIVAFRNFIVHEYFGVDLELVWDIVENKIPVLEREVLALIEKINI